MFVHACAFSQFNMVLWFSLGVVIAHFYKKGKTCITETDPQFQTLIILEEKLGDNENH